MVIIGLCGGSGSGKSTVADELSHFGFYNIDTDEIYHELISTKTDCFYALVNEFGTVIEKDGKIDRKKLAQIVFSESGEKKLLQLNKISHYYVLKRVREIISTLDSEYLGAVVDAPLLFESGFDKECDFIVGVIADKEERIQRIVQRDSISVLDAKKRIKKQIGDDEIIRRANAVIYNNFEINALKNEVLEIVNKIKKEVIKQ